MKLNRFFASSLGDLSSKKLILKKLVSTAITTVVMGAATLLFASFHKQPSFQLQTKTGNEAIGEMSDQVLSRGLSRQRTDFDKALGILAEAAVKDSRLVDYYTRVSKRVKGEQAKPENGSGVRIVRRARKINPPLNSNDRVTGAEAQSQAPSEGLGDIARTAMAVESIPAPPVPDGYASPQTSTIDAASSKLTTGDMAYDLNPAIGRWVNYYTATQGGRRTMTIGIERSNSYLDMARAEFRRAGVPEDLVWLALVESVWNPSAVSPAAAGGIWQFIPKTATEYGLRVASGNDERADPLKQTRVAATYLRDLYTIFGDWALAMAAYNSGEPRVMDAIVKNGRANFWELYDKQLLPKETRDYVPKILAAIKVAGQADIYGFTPATEIEASAGQ
jgi:hypothetical protein